MTTKKKAPKKPAKAKRVRPPKAKQQTIADWGPPSIPALDTAAERYYDAVRDRLPYTKAEAEAKDELVRQIHLHHDQLGKATSYKTPDGYVVNFTDVTKVSVKKATHEGNGEAD